MRLATQGEKRVVAIKSGLADDFGLMDSEAAGAGAKARQWLTPKAHTLCRSDYSSNEISPSSRMPVCVLTHEGMPLLVVARPHIKIVLRIAHDRNRIDGAGPMGKRGMCDWRPTVDPA